MRSIGSSWDLAQVEIDALPPERRPTTPPPPPGTCRGPSDDAPCGLPVPARWRPPVADMGPFARGAWLAPSLCTACTEALARSLREADTARAATEAGIPRRYRWATFTKHTKQRQDETWAEFRARLDEDRETLGITRWNARAAEVVRAWRPTPGAAVPRPGVIFLTGPVGSGKTTLAGAAAMRAIEDGIDHVAASPYEPARFSVKWVGSADMWEALRGEASGKRSSRGALAIWASADVLILDDLGTIEAIKPWHRDAIEFLICQRYNAGSALLITSNLRLDSTDPDEPTIASTYGERVVSRLLEGLGGRRGGTPPGYVELVGVDWRADAPHAAAKRAPSPSVEPARETRGQLPAPVQLGIFEP